MTENKQPKTRKRLPWLPRKLLQIAAIALALTLANVFSPVLRQWFGRLLPGVDYKTAAMQLTHEMEKAGDLIAVRYTDTGIMKGEINALFLGTVSEVTAPYQYEIGLGVKLKEVQLVPEENEMRVLMPETQLLYDSFQVTGEAQNKDFWRYATQNRYQKMQDEQQEACRREYLDNPVYLQQAWEAECEQLEALFRQWTGEALRLTFVRGN